MNIKIEVPIKILRRFISDVLIERSNKIMDDCEELMNEEIKQVGVVSDYSNSVGWESCGTRVLADDVASGVISIEEAMEEILRKDEIESVKNKCLNWFKNNKV